MDADDVTLPGRFEQQVTFLDANPDRAMVASFVEHIDADGASLGVVRSPVEQGEIVRSLRQGNCFAHGTVMFRRDRAEAPREAVSSRVRCRLRKSSAWQRWILRPRVEAQASRALEALSTAGRNVVATRDFLTGLLEDPFDS